MRLFSKEKKKIFGFKSLTFPTKYFYFMKDYLNNIEKNKNKNKTKEKTELITKEKKSNKYAKKCKRQRKYQMNKKIIIGKK